VPKYGYLVVEGPHDVELVYRLLHPHGLERVRQEAELDPFFLQLVPRTYPPDGDLLKRVPVPLFLQSSTHAVAVHSAGSDTRMIETMEEDSVFLDTSKLTGIGVLFDADYAVSSSDRYAVIRERLREKGFSLPENPGEVKTGPPRLGGFVLPDNISAGTLEDILLDCANLVYPTLLTTATAHVDSASRDKTLEKQDLRELLRPAGRHKAIVGSIASILRPGKAVQNSLQDNRWLCEAALAIPRVRALQIFLLNLLELTETASATE